MSISLKQLRYFVAAAETGRISHAASELNISQSAVTIAIQQLEMTVGTRLLVRSPDGVTVTPEGSRFLARSRDILSAVEECVNEARTSTALTARTLRVGVSPTVAGYFLPRHLAKFQTNTLGIGIELFEGPRSMIEQGLMDGELDLAVMLISNIVHTEELTSKTLLRSARRLWVAPSHPITRLRSITLAEVAKYPYVMLTTDEASNTTLGYWTAQGLKPKTVFRTTSIEAVRSMVGSGLGVTVLSELIYRPRSYDNQRIELLDLADQVPTMDIGLVWRSECDLPPGSQAFCDFLQFSASGDSRAAMEVTEGQRHPACDIGK